MILLVLFVVAMFLWFLALLPWPADSYFGRALGWLPFICVLLLFLILHGLRV